MAISYVLFLLLVITSLVPISIASPPHKLRLSATELAALEGVAPPPPRPDQPSTFFEVDRPHRPPPGSFGPCSTLLLSHSFAYTYTKPPVTAAYSAPPCLAAAGVHAASVISLAVLEWRATCRGVQFDRIFGVWLAGAELLRGCTAEPRRSGVEWTVSKDVTKYASLFASRNSTLVVNLGNVVDDTYTGVYHANVTLHLYFHHPPPPPPQQPGLGPADVIVPISLSLPLDDGLWFQIKNRYDMGSASVAVPRNTFRAVLEVYLSYHSDDEFWYTSTPREHGPFREVTVLIDGDLVGAVWPFPVIYTGGINPLLWQPIAGIGTFSLPSYDVEVTPFLGKLLDGEEHEFAFQVTNAQDVWFVDANLHLWLDPRCAATTAAVVSYDAPALDTTIAFRPYGPGDGLYYTTSFRHVSASGWVQTASYGRITATWTQRLGYENTNRIQEDESLQAVNQTTDAYSGAHVADRAGVLYSQEAQQSFALGMFVGVVNQTSNDTYTIARSVRLGLGEERVAAGRSGFWARSLRNVQDCEMDVDVEEGDAVGVSWGTRQTYRYEATDACYFRNVTSLGYAVVSDHSDEVCVKGSIAAGVVEELAAAGAARLSS
ncbi:hypothetical protein HU200_055932 [Digitaria exilis]|uniref:Peptide N-acetyl-beta-D-glucosaminyl asparaginase amidase A N-terminal domain-containing protein n=1 Tax=Digitaria exilis TaxID=1010633 RepID=A0A835AFQ5_9POAL|nr:hypothetical protein HU200_055932 [Digitaria exilis]